MFGADVFAHEKKGLCLRRWPDLLDQGGPCLRVLRAALGDLLLQLGIRRGHTGLFYDDFHEQILQPPGQDLRCPWSPTPGAEPTRWYQGHATAGACLPGGGLVSASSKASRIARATPLW